MIFLGKLNGFRSIMALLKKLSGMQERSVEC